MKQHVNKVVSTCYYHLWWLFQLRSSVTQNVMSHLVTSLVLQHIDSCNSVLINLPTSTIAPLQRIHQNTTACLVLGLDYTAHITPAPKKLHSLAICPSPYYLQNRYTDALHTPPGLSDISPRSSTFCQHWFQQKLSSIWAATTVQTRTKIAHFLPLDPKYGSLLPSFRLTNSHMYMEFHRQLKTYLFKQAFDC